MSDTKYIMNQVGELILKGKQAPEIHPETQKYRDEPFYVQSNGIVASAEIVPLSKQLPWANQVLKKMETKSEQVSPLLQEWLDKKNYELVGMKRRPK